MHFVLLGSSFLALYNTGLRCLQNNEKELAIDDSSVMLYYWVNCLCSFCPAAAKSMFEHASNI